MAAHVDLTAVIFLLVITMNDMPRSDPPPPRVFDPFASNDQFDLLSRYATISVPLDNFWNGDTSTFPSYGVSLRIRTKEEKWDAPDTTNATTVVLTPDPTNILNVANKNILTKYHSITYTKIEATTTACLNDRAIQNSISMFSCINFRFKVTLKTQSSPNLVTSRHTKTDMLFSNELRLSRLCLLSNFRCCHSTIF